MISLAHVLSDFIGGGMWKVITNTVADQNFIFFI